MRKDDLTRLRHMIEFAQEALRCAQNRTREDLYHDQMLTLALMKAIETVRRGSLQALSGAPGTTPGASLAEHHGHAA
jgi:hypothetical protein